MPRARLILQACAVWVSACLACHSIAADDVVIVRSAADPEARVRRSGQILDYTGMELTLRTSFGTTERIPTNRVVEVETAWLPAHIAARIERRAGKLEEAIAALREALGAERRAWAKRQIAAELSATYLEAGRIAEAVEAFLPIAASDSATPHYDSVPIAWRAAAPDATLESRAAVWLADKENELARLLGASWLLPGSQRAAAIAALGELSNSSDERIAGLAAIQLWRTKLVSATPDDTGRWHAELQELPPDIQATGWYVLGEALTRQETSESAALAYLKVPLLFPQQRPLAADALLAAGKQLEKIGRGTQAAGLYRELSRDYAHLLAATDAQARLLKLTETGKK